MEQILCDGCNVRSPHEHRCHGTDGPITVRGDSINAGCRCEPCQKQPTMESLREWAEQGYPKDFVFSY